MLTADPDADLEGDLAAWRRYRRRKRTDDVHWIDLLYQAYLTGFFGLVAVIGASGAVGDEPLSPAELDSLVARGPAWIGGLAALALALGLRSGSRGGPLALERAEVRHVLLAPVDRTTALVAPALRRLRFMAFVAVVVGGIVGNLAVRRLPGHALTWVAVGALAGATLVGLGFGAALVASGVRLPRWAATLAGLVLVATALADGLEVTSWSPTRPFGDLALWPLDADPQLAAPVLVGAVLVAVGFRLLGRTSLEAAERRSTLVGQLRFAVTLQDLRTVIVLRRQLAMELPRLRPWLRIPFRGTGRFPIAVRGVRGVLRWPAARLARLVLLAAVAGLAMRGAWAGTTPLVVLVGLAAFVAGLDAIEALAQEVDHPSRRDASPLPAPAIHVRHVPVAVAVMVVVAGLAAVVAAAPGRGAVPVGVALSAVLPLALGGVGGALVSVLGSDTAAVRPGDSWSLTPPEAQGMRLAVRTTWPPAIAVLGSTAVVFARNAAEGAGSATAGAQATWIPVAVLFALIVGWVRFRDEIRAWFARSMAEAEQQRKARAGIEADG